MCSRGSESWRRTSRLGRSWPPGDRAGRVGDGSTVLLASAGFQNPERSCERTEVVQPDLVFIVLAAKRRLPGGWPSAVRCRNNVSGSAVRCRRNDQPRQSGVAFCRAVRQSGVGRTPQLRQSGVGETPDAQRTVILCAKTGTAYPSSSAVRCRGVRPSALASSAIDFRNGAGTCSSTRLASQVSKNSGLPWARSIAAALRCS